jgi:SAM-dependent methyltransferase
VGRTYAEQANYPEQAGTYDATRSASPTVLELLLRFLGDADGRTLLDVAGGTGNYAEAVARQGFRPVIVDRERSMLARSIPKIGPRRQVLGDALRLPIGDAAVDAVMIVSAIHQFPDQRAAIEEARRVIRAGPLVVQAFAWENIAPSFAFEYFRGSGPDPALHPRIADFEAWMLDAGFARVEHERFVYRDVADATFHAMHVDPEALADERLLRNTSFWHVLDEEAQRAGLEALHRDLRTGRLAERVREGLRLAERHGHGVVLSAWP